MECLPNYKKRLYTDWMTMKQSCVNPKNHNYKNYGARGIKVCKEWEHSYETFEKWAYANGYDDVAPKGECTIDRINVNGNYEPNNCRWVNSKIQGNNKRDNHIIKIGDISHTLSEWCEIYSISPRQVDSRVKNCDWSYEKAITTPLKSQGWQHNEEVRKKICKKFLTCGNETKSLSEWSRQTGINECSILARINKYGWSIEKTLTTPIRRHKIYGT